MNDFTNQEYQRILGNPDNEIISDSLKERLNLGNKFVDFFISFNGNDFDCSLDSFSISTESKNISRISILVGVEVIKQIFSSEDFKIYSKEIGVEVNSKMLDSIDCFKFNSDTYVLELSLKSEEILDD